MGELALLRVLRRRRDPVVVDLAFVVVFGAIAQWEIWLPGRLSEALDPPGFIGGSKVVNSLTLLLAAVALAWRRSRPLASTAAVMTGIAAQAALTGHPPVGPVVAGPVLLSVYSLAAYGSRREALIGLVLAVAAGAIHDISDPALRTAADVDAASFWWLVTLVAWIIGRYVRRRRQARVLEELAARLEREREEQARAAAARERARVARELHDVVSHGVSLIALQAGAAQETLDEQPERARERLAAIEGTAREAASELRRLLGVLRRDEHAPERAPQPGLAELEHMVEQLHTAGVDVTLEIDGRRERLAPGIELSAYRIVQEALTNAVKHGRPNRVCVMVRYRPDELELEVSDNGRDKTRTDGGGYGLIGMRERVALYGGRLEAGPGGGGGYVLRAWLPREPP
jgi:signal transduction histidine kinase